MSASQSKRVASLGGETSEEKQRRMEGDTENGDTTGEDITDVAEMFRSLKGLMKTMIGDVRSDIRSVGGQVEAATAMAAEAKQSADKAVADVAELKKEVEEVKGSGLEKAVKKVIEESFPGVADPWSRASQATSASHRSNTAPPPRNRRDDAEDGGNSCKAKIRGFVDDTHQKEMLPILDQFIGEAPGVKERYCPFKRNDHGIIVFETPDACKDFLKEVKKKQPQYETSLGKVTLRAMPVRSQDELQRSKPFRTLKRAICELVGDTDKLPEGTIDINYSKGIVYFGSIRAGELPRNGVGQFKVNVEKIDAEVKKFSLDFTGEQVHELYLRYVDNRQ